MPSMSEEERLHKALAGDAAIIATMVKAIGDKFGPEGLAALRDSLTETYRKLIPAVARQAGARVGDGGVEDWAKVERYMCALCGMEYQAEITPKRGVLRVSSCPMAGQYQRLSPGCCPEVFIGIERGIAQAINPRLQIKGNKYLTRGEECCEIVCELTE